MEGAQNIEILSVKCFSNAFFFYVPLINVYIFSVEEQLFLNVDVARLTLQENECT